MWAQRVGAAHEGAAWWQKAACGGPAGLRRLPRHLRRDGTLATLPHSDPTSTSAQAQASAVHVYVCQRSSGMARGRAAARAGAHGARCSRGARRSAARSRPAAGAAGRGERSAGARARTSGALCNSCAPCSAPVQNARSFCLRSENAESAYLICCCAARAVVTASAFATSHSEFWARYETARETQHAYGYPTHTHHYAKQPTKA